MTDQEIAAEVRKAAAEFNVALDRATEAGLKTKFTLRFTWNEDRKECTRVDVETIEVHKVTTF